MHQCSPPERSIHCVIREKSFRLAHLLQTLSRRSRSINPHQLSPKSSSMLQSETIPVLRSHSSQASSQRSEPINMKDHWSRRHSIENDSSAYVRTNTLDCQYYTYKMEMDFREKSTEHSDDDIETVQRKDSV